MCWLVLAYSGLWFACFVMVLAFVSLYRLALACVGLCLLVITFDCMYLHMFVCCDYDGLCLIV